MYPDNWPRCPGCGDFALDGHITCGRVECDEGEHRGEAGALWDMADGCDEPEMFGYPKMEQ